MTYIKLPLRTAELMGRSTSKACSLTSMLDILSPEFPVLLQKRIDTPAALYYHEQYGGNDMITLRLDPQLEQQLIHTAKHLGLSKSELIRQSLLSYMEQVEKKGAWETGHDLFGKYASGRDDLSANRKQLIKNKINAKRA